MTLMVTINGRESIWMLADRRLSYGDNRTPKDDARKIAKLETRDGIALLGYAGLGATALGTEPSDWISAVLRGRNLSLEHSLGILADAVKDQFPRHLISIEEAVHRRQHIFVTAFLNKEVRYYTIDLIITANRKDFYFRSTRHNTISGRTPRIGMGGSGAPYLYRNRQWIRPLLRLANACDKKRINSILVADYLAAMNYSTYQNVSDHSVGPNCIVAWAGKNGGGGHRSFSGTTADPNTDFLPNIARGTDFTAVTKIILRHARKSLESNKPSDLTLKLDPDKINSELAKLPDAPDEKLR